MYWMMMGVGDRKLVIIKAQNIGHTRDKNGKVESNGPHTYRVEATLMDKDGVVDDVPYVVGPIPQNKRIINFTVTHKRELGHISLARVLLKVLEGELENEKTNAHAEAFEIKPEPKILDDRPLLSAPKDSS